jgi:hypothetical protein
MPGKPWDKQNVKPNILVLGRIRVGNRLSVLQDNVRARDLNFGFGGDGQDHLLSVFRVETGLGGKIRRNKRGEDITDVNLYYIPLTKLFTTAMLMHRSGHKHGITKQDMQRAIRGLRNLQNSYGRRNASHLELARIVAGLENYIQLRGGLTKRPGLIKLEGTGRTINLLNLTMLKGMEQKCYKALDIPKKEIVEAEDTQDNARVECDATPLEQRTIFGYSGRSTQALTQLPTMKDKKYRRRKLGICDAWMGDAGRYDLFLNNHNAKLDIPPISGGASPAERRKIIAAVKAIFEAVGNDEAMLFLLSQLVSQAGVPALLAFLLIGRFKYYKHRGLPAILSRKHNGKKWQFSIGGNFTKKVYIDVGVGNVVKLTVVSTVEAHRSVIAFDEGGQMFMEGEMTLQNVVNLRELEFTFALLVQREDDRILWKLDTAMMKYTQ